MSRTVRVRNLRLGEGLPKICVPLSDTDAEGLQNSLGPILESPCDLVEWRADFYKGLDDDALRGQALTLLRQGLGDRPILFTIRTSVDGSRLQISTEDYVRLNLAAIESGLVDMIDVELSRGGAVVQQLLTAAHAVGVKVIVSCHNFYSTPGKDEIVAHMVEAQRLGCDVAKYAVMPRCSRDVLTLLDASVTMLEEHPDTPFITMSMSSLGSISRVAGGLTGSAVTFGTVGKGTSPGQLPAGILSEFLRVLG